MPTPGLLGAIGAEVLVDFINGEDLPPLAALDFVFGCARRCRWHMPRL